MSLILGVTASGLSGGGGTIGSGCGGGVGGGAGVGCAGRGQGAAQRPVQAVGGDSLASARLTPGQVIAEVEKLLYVRRKTP